MIDKWIMIVCLILTRGIMIYLFVFRSRISNMAGMMAAMTIGMSNGLAVGIVMSLWLPSQFLYATLWSILIGGELE
mgnify:CR=1 FL=1